MKHIKLFESFLNESSDKLNGLRQIAHSMIEKGNIYGLKIPSYPFVLALTGAGYDDDCTSAWIIQDKEDFKRWVNTVNTNSTTFPDLSGKNKKSTHLDDIKQKLGENVFDQEDWGSVVNFFSDEAELKKAVRKTEDNDKDSDGEKLEEGDLYYAIIEGNFLPDRKVKKEW